MTEAMIPQFVHPDDLPEFLAELAEFQTRVAPLDVEVRVRHAIGHYVWIHMRAVADFDA